MTGNVTCGGETLRERERERERELYSITSRNYGPYRAAKCEHFSGASNEPIFAAIGARGAAPRRFKGS
jgi:hypothetical protein